MAQSSAWPGGCWVHFGGYHLSAGQAVRALVEAGPLPSAGQQKAAPEDAASSWWPFIIYLPPLPHARWQASI